MVTISLEISDELARRLTLLQDRLPEIIELGLRHLEVEIKERNRSNPYPTQAAGLGGPPLDGYCHYARAYHPAPSSGSSYPD